MEIHKSCVFLGHRAVDCDEHLKQKIKGVVENLIVYCGTTNFLFGSRSNFVSFCLNIVTELKLKYPHIKRIAYTCNHESCILESERTVWQKIYSSYKLNTNLLTVDEEIYYTTRAISNKASYIQRNFAMIDASYYCVFYYNKEYKPPKRKLSKHSILNYQPNSGTKLAYDYAIKKHKKIINVSLL